MKWVKKKQAKYSVNESHIRKNRRFLYLLPAILLVLCAAVIGYKILNPAEASVEKTVSKLQFDTNVSTSEQTKIASAINQQELKIRGTVKVSVTTDYTGGIQPLVLGAYVPVVSVNSTKQAITSSELSNERVYFSKTIDPIQQKDIATLIGLEDSQIQTIDSLENIGNLEIVFIPVEELSEKVKLLKLDDTYYLDSFDNGALFRTAVVEQKSNGLESLTLNTLPNKESVLKINQTGVTALTRLMMKKLNQVGDATYFSKFIGEFLADADITHISNESSFQDGCAYSNTVLCSDPRFIDTLKASGVDLVELTGNHNNDVGSQYNTETINLYKSLDWNTFGGGLNKSEAAKFHIIDTKASKVAFLGYNYADSPNGGAIAGTTTAGANSFDIDLVKQDIANAKKQAQYVIVDVQFWECYAYPDGYVEFPECDVPIGEQKSVFRQISDLGADMVIGTQAHQPQTYELYNGKPIYYGLGNLYFDQTQWPGTERSLILTQYFNKGKLVQTKLTPTIYDNAYQTRVASPDEAEYLLQRLQDARQNL